jgi:hypothetical protein
MCPFVKTLKGYDAAGKIATRIDDGFASIVHQRSARVKAATCPNFLQACHKQRQAFGANFID